MRGAMAIASSAAVRQPGSVMASATGPICPSPSSRVHTGNPTGVAYASGGAISYNGWTVQITGTPRAGDTFTISPNTNGTSDSRNAGLLAVRILAASDPALTEKMARFQQELADTARAKDAALQQRIARPAD